MDSSHYTVLSSPRETRKAMVGNKEASRQSISAVPSGIMGGGILDWKSIFQDHPNLSPPGYEQAVAAAKAKMEQRKLAPKELPKRQAKKTTRKRK